MHPEFTKKQLREAEVSDADFAYWYVEEIMSNEFEYYVADLGVETCEHQTRMGRLYAKHFGFASTENQALFLTLMWGLGPNFYEEKEHAAILANQDLSEDVRAYELFEVTPQATEIALDRADHLYWFPWEIPGNILGLKEDPEWPDDDEDDNAPLDQRS